MGGRWASDFSLTEKLATRRLDIFFSLNMPISCVALFVFFVPILLYHLPGSHSPTLGFFSPLFMGLTKAFGCQGVPFGYPPRHIPISMRYLVSGPRARSDWFAGATR